MQTHHLAQLNVARLLAPVDSPQLADFAANLDRINALAESSPGFVWRLQTEEGDATALRPFGEDILVNMSVWQDLESLRNFVYKSAHSAIMRRRREWFDAMREFHIVLWWVTAGHRPDEAEAEDRLMRLRRDGPGPQAFHFARPFSATGERHVAARGA